MLNNIDLQNILFIDIETVPEIENYENLDEVTKELFEQKTAYQRKDEITAEAFYDKAAIWAEFGKIVCLSAGYFTFKNDERQFRVTSLYGLEKEILENFYTLLQNFFNEPKHILCGHNIKEFDIPFIARRFLIHHLALPEKLNLIGKKAWETPLLDTMELWKFGDYKHYTSLKLLTHVLGIKSPKDDINGSQVAHVFYKEKNIKRIAEYCEKDVDATAQILLRLKNKSLLTEKEIVIK